MRRRYSRKYSLTPEQYLRIRKASNHPAIRKAVSDRLQAQARNPDQCICMRDPLWDPAEAMPAEIRRMFGVLTTKEVPVHMSSCPHSELRFTTQRPKRKWTKRPR